MIKSEKIWLVSDTHFNHPNVIKYCNRPFDNVDHMNEVMIINWNNYIGPNDDVFHLGDFALGNSLDCVNILKRLNGQIRLCIGSHDKTALHNKCKDFFVDIRESFLLNIKRKEIFIAHHAHYVWPKSHYNSIHCFGHSHGGLKEYEKNGKMLDIGVDVHDFKPWHVDEIIEIMKDRPDNFNLVKNG